MNKLIMTFGNSKTLYKNFDTDGYPEDLEFLKNNNNKVNLSTIGFASEWEDYVNYSKSNAYIKDNKLYVEVYGLPDFINTSTVKTYYSKVLDQYIEEEYGEFFETDPGCPICMIVEHNGNNVIV